jgi:hypothetical protein
MRLKNYLIQELAMKRAKVGSPQYWPESTYIQDITLSDGQKFKFLGYYFRTADIWEVVFEDEEERRYKVEKPQGTSLELFATLEKVFKDFLEKALPDKFRFTADIDERSRVKLYDLLAKKIQKAGLGYKFTKKKSVASVIYNFSHWSVK